MVNNGCGLKQSLKKGATFSEIIANINQEHVKRSEVTRSLLFL